MAIHSVCVAAEHRLRQVATRMLKHYVNMVAAGHPTVTTIKLMAKQHLIPFYISCGFTCNGLSPIVHGVDPWFDLSLDLTVMRQPTFTVVNAFTTKPGCGNPAAVVRLPYGPRSGAWMQLVAKDFNLSETVFVMEREDGRYDLRYFTPTSEVGLCGHATLAAASVVGEDRGVFVTGKGVELVARKGEGGCVVLTFPSNEPSVVTDAERVEEVRRVLKEGLGVEKDAVIGVYCTDDDIMVEISSESFNGIGTVNMEVLRTTSAYGHGLIVCCVVEGRGSSQSDFSSRFFAPKIGIDEDPVCGRAHVSLASHFAKKLGKRVLTGVQASSRGGEVAVEVGTGTVDLRGQWVHVRTGKLMV